ncbi:transposase [Methanolobus sp. WCC5]|uniref:transposase n=1 Tax=Methanolobus sp. WCC5 TaxID=3125785 RepID=UPI003246D972
MEEWAHNWLTEQRKLGEKGLEIKTFSKGYYVYRSTTYWDKELKKRRKTSTYLGKLDKDKGLIDSQKTVISNKRVRSLWEYGNSSLLHTAMEDLIAPLQNAFGEIWEEIYALALVRITGHVPLKRAGVVWEKLYPVVDMQPSMTPKNLSKVLKEVGVNRKAQNDIFRELSSKDKHLVYDLSAIFTRSEGINFAEKGYNKEHFYIPQINFALLCTANENLPTMMRILPGSVRDVKSLALSIQEVGVEDKTLILDRGFCSKTSVKILKKQKLTFVIPTRRNSVLYNKPMELNAHFFYHERLIKSGKWEEDETFLYLFEDNELRKEEEYTLYKRYDEKKITEEEFNESLKKAGRILLISNLDMECEDIFLMYKKRDCVEKHYDTYKNLLEADKIYLQDNESLFGHLFISFLSLYGYAKIENYIRGASLTKKYSPRDLIEMFGKVYMIDIDGQMMLTEVPKKIEDLGKKLNLELFPK